MDPTTDTPKTPTLDAPWYTPSIVLRLAGGETLVKPGKAVQRGTPEQCSKWTGINTKTLKRLAEAGFIRVAKPTPWVAFYYPAEIEEFIAKTEADPDFWSDVKRKAYIESRRLRTKKVADDATPQLPGMGDAPTGKAND
jgi:hypothetical protein